MTRRRIRLLLELPSGPEEVVVGSSPEGWFVEIGGKSSRLDLAELPDGRLSLVFEDGRQVCGRVATSDGGAIVSTRRGVDRIAIADPSRHRLAAAESAGGGSGEEVHALMPGRVLEVAVREGTVAAARALLLVLEAMKMQNEIRTVHGGLVVRVAVVAGQSVEGGALLVALAPVAESS